MQGINIAGSSLDRSTSHVFKSKRDQWTVNLRPSILSLETNNYHSFEDFESRIEGLVDACKSFIDSDFFTRIGVRYINVLPYDRSTVADWINPSLVSNLASGILGDPSEYAQQVRGRTSVGGYLFQHGLTAIGDKTGYMLDFDFYAEDAELKDSMGIVRELHDREHEMFLWTLGDAAKQFLDSQGARNA